MLESFESRPVGARRGVNRIACWWRHEREVDLAGCGVKVDGCPVTEVSIAAAVDLLDHPFASLDEQAATLHELLRWARLDGSHYTLPVVRTRFLGKTTIAGLRIARVGSAHWRAFWALED